MMKKWRYYLKKTVKNETNINNGTNNSANYNNINITP